MIGIEPTTVSLKEKHSSTELHFCPLTQINFNNKYWLFNDLYQTWTGVISVKSYRNYQLY